MTMDLQHLTSANLSSPSEWVDFYNKSLSSLLDLHAPIKTRKVSFSGSAPWFTCDLWKMKAAGRVIEWRLKTSGLTVHRQGYREHQKAYSKSVTDARSQFYSNIISSAPGNFKQLFFTINQLLKLKTSSHTENTVEQCNSFLTFSRPKLTPSAPLTPAPPLYLSRLSAHNLG